MTIGQLVYIPFKPRPLKPYTPPKPSPRRAAKGEHMTIAAGFRCQDSLVLCADREITYGSSLKVRRSKIHKIEAPGHHTIVFAGSGYDDYIRLAIDQTKRQVQAGNSGQQIREALEEVVYEIYHRHIHPFYPEPDAVLQLIIGVSVGGELELYKSYSSVLRSVDSYEFIGAGEILATYLASRYRYGELSPEQAAGIATDIFLKVKDHVPTCGGKTDVVILAKDGSGASFDSSSKEGVYIVLEMAIQDLFSSYVNPKVSAGEFAASVEAFAETVKRFRSRGF